jgi:hypothetical protein
MGFPDELRESRTKNINWINNVPSPNNIWPFEESFLCFQFSVWKNFEENKTMEKGDANEEDKEERMWKSWTFLFPVFFYDFPSLQFPPVIIWNLIPFKSIEEEKTISYISELISGRKRGKVRKKGKRGEEKFGVFFY